MDFPMKTLDTLFVSDYMIAITKNRCVEDN